MAESPKETDSIESLLLKLQDSCNAKAWRLFLDRYGAIIMSLACQHAHNPHDSQDCFLFVCEKLYEDNCRKLCAFDQKRGGSFETWLSAIAANLCTDWCRDLYGRRPGPPPAIKELPPMEQLAFGLAVVKGLDRESCLIGVRQRFPETTRSDLSNALAVIHTALSPKQRWKYTAFRQRGRVMPIDSGSESLDLDKDANPLIHALETETRTHLESALSSLTARELLMLRLRYEQELTLEEIAVVVGLGDLHQVRRKIQAALRKLSELLSKPDSP